MRWFLDWSYLMQIASTLGYRAPQQFFERDIDAPQRPRSWTKRLDTYMSNHETGFERISRVRQDVLNKTRGTHSFDQRLSHPEQFKNRGIRALIHLAKHLDELAESCADISGVTERLTRNMISSGEKADMSLVIASAFGRAISGQLSLGGVAVHKVAGAGLYALSTLLSVAALALACSKNVGIRSEAEIKKAMEASNFDSSAYLVVAKKLLTIKEAVLGKVLDRIGSPDCGVRKSIHKWARFMSRHHRVANTNLAIYRKTHSNYMWKNLHQYGPVTRALMHTAYGTFQGVNKLMVSFDKHVGTAMGKYLLSKSKGEVLSCRLGLTVAMSAAAAVSVPMAPLVVGLSTLGIAACGVAFLAIGMAKLNVQLTYDWKGNIQPPLQRQVFGRVTPT